jgi:hypothetical protein
VDRVRSRGQDRARLKYSAGRAARAIPEAGEREQVAVVHLEAEWLLCLACPLPFIEAIGGDEAAARSERFAEGGKRARRFRSGVNHPRCARAVLRPRRNEAPADKRQVTHWLLRVLADDRNRLRRSEVVPRTPVALPRIRGEVLFEELLPPRQSIVSAHWMVMSEAALYAGPKCRASAERPEFNNSIGDRDRPDDASSTVI